MTFEQLVFYVFAGIAVVAAIMMITVRNPVKAALWLVLAFISAAGIWLLAEAEFLGLVLILVYVGAVMVLFLFVVMMLDINLAEMKEGFAQYVGIGLFVAFIIFGLMYTVLGPAFFGLDQYQPAVHDANYSNTKEIAVPLYTQHAYAFVLAAVLLLVGIVAAIALTMRRRTNKGKALYQDIDAQVRVQASDRLTMVSMKPEIEPDLPAAEEEKK